MTITNNGTILFVFIAGFLFHHLNKDSFNYKTYLTKKFLYVATPYVIISIPAIVDKLFFDPGNHWWMQGFFNHLGMAGKIAYMLATGKHSGTLWFIPMIITFYFLAPLIILYSRTEASKYVTPLICAASLYLVRFGYYANTGISFLYFFPIYLFGTWASANKGLFHQRAQLTIILLTGSAYVLMTILEVVDIIPFTHYMELRDSQQTAYIFNLSKLKAIMLSIFLLSSFQRFASVKFPFLKLLADYSFGIYFIHLYVINVFQILNRRGYFLSSLNIFTYLLYVSAVTVICILIIYVVKKVLGKQSRIVIGS